MLNSPVSRALCAALVAATMAALPLAHAEDLKFIYNLAKTNDAQYRAAQADLRSRREAVPQAKAARRPQIEFSGNSVYADQDAPVITDQFLNQGLQLNLNQMVYRRELGVQLDQAELSVQQAEAEFEATDQDLITRVAQAYFNVLGAGDNLDFVRAEKEAIGEQLAQSQSRFEVGLIAITDVKEAQARFDLSVAEEIEAENLLFNTKEALRVITGAAPVDLAKLIEDYPLKRPDPASIDAWVGIAEKQNRVLIAARLGVDIAREGIELNRSDHYPTLDFQAQGAWQDNDGGQQEGITRSASVALQLNWQLYTSGGISSRVNQARADFESARETGEQQRRDVVRNTRQSYLGVLAAISRVGALRRAVESNEASAQATQAGFDVGTRTAVDVLITLQETYRAQRDYARARYDYILESLRLRQAAGTLTEQHIQAVNNWLK